MGDSYVYFLPRDPWLAPTTEAASRAMQVLRDELIKCDGIEIEESQTPQAHIGGDSEYGARCPHCETEIAEDEVFVRIKAEYDLPTGFRLEREPMSCCGTPVALHELIFPQRSVGFARFAITVHHPVWKRVEAYPEGKRRNELGERFGFVNSRNWSESQGEEWAEAGKAQSQAYDRCLAEILPLVSEALGAEVHHVFVSV